MSFQLFITKFLAFFFGCFVCHWLQLRFGVIPVAAAALTGFAGSFLHLPKFYDRKALHAALYAGSFAGMTSSHILLGLPYLLLISMIGTILFLWSRPYLNGFGGKLGTISFLSALAVMLWRSVW